MADVFAVIQVEGAGEVPGAHDVRHIRVAEAQQGEPLASGRVSATAGWHDLKIARPPMSWSETAPGSSPDLARYMPRSAGFVTLAQVITL